MDLVIVTAAGKRQVVEVSPTQQLTVVALRGAVAQQLGLPLASLHLVCGGKPLQDDEAVSRLKPGDTVLAAVAPRPPPQEVRQVATGGADEPEDDELRLQLPPDAPAWQRRLLHLLQYRLRLPEPVLAVLVRLGPRFWIALLAWMAGAKLASMVELGPVYIVCSMIAAILLNLGKKREGDWSAYSLFNPGLRRLPGQMTAEDLDAQLRRGHM